MSTEILVPLICGGVAFMLIVAAHMSDYDLAGVTENRGKLWLATAFFLALWLVIQIV